MTRAPLFSLFVLALGCTRPAAPPTDDRPASDVEGKDAEVSPGIVGGTELPSGAKLHWVRASTCHDGSPMTLTASDGTGLRLTSLQARAVVQGPLAFTELELVFDNPEPRVLEGRFSITLPPDAALSRFAMEIDGRYQEGEVVERRRAQAVYEDFLHRRQDPALLEADAGNVFVARVFPIPAHGQKKLIVSYSQQLAHLGEPYRLPVCGLPQLERLDVDVAIARPAGGDATVVDHLTLHEAGYAPTMDLEAHTGIGAEGVRSGDLAIVRVSPRLDAPAEPLQDLTILFDTSASRVLDFSGQVDRLARLVSEVARRHPELSLRVVAFDQTVAEIYAGPARGFGAAETARLAERGALGASDLEGALAALASSRRASSRLLVLGDGIATAGHTDAATLRDRVRDLAEAGVRRVDAIVDGGIQDAALLRQLVRGTAASDGVVLDTRIELAAIVDRLEKATRSGITVDVPGAEWVWPRTLDGVQPGDDVLVYVQLPPDRPVEIALGGASVATPRPSLLSVPAPLVSRAHAQARITALQAERATLAPDDRARDEALRNEIIELSTRHRVLSDLTALLVLETEYDYAQYGIDRAALGDILTVGTQGIEVRQRNTVPEPFADAEHGRDKAKNEASAVKGDAPEAKASADDAPADGFLERAGEGDAPAPPSIDPASPEPEPVAIPQEERNDEAGNDGGIAGGVPGGVVGGVASTSPARAGSGQSGMVQLRGEQAAPRRARPPTPITGRSADPPESPKIAEPYDGRFATVMQALAAGDRDAATREVTAWRTESPGDVLALIALGESLEAAGDRVGAARAYGSLVDLFPSRVDIRRMAGERLERLDADGLALAIDTYAKAVEQRPDHASGHRLLAYALLKDGQHERAFDVLLAGYDRPYPSGRFAEVHRILREDLGLVGAAWIAADPSARAKVDKAIASRGGTLPSSASTRFVLNWETDANDVDLHVYDAKGGHAFYSRRALASGGELYADVTTGYGPECFAIPGRPSAGPYVIQAHYYRRGPMGYGMGKLQVIEHDGKGTLTFSEHPFVIMRDDAYVDLATIKR